MKTLGLLALWLATLVIAFAGGWSVMYRVSYVLLLLITISWVWTLVSIRTLTVERRNRAQRAQVGGFFEEWVAVDNISYLPKAWVEMRSESNLVDHAVRRGFFLGPKSRRTWMLRTECTSRGKFHLGDIAIATGDPFGLFQRQARFGSETTILIYPRTVDFVTPGRIPGQLPGGVQQSGHVPFVTPTVAGVRDYQPSDSYNRIHWPTTARTGRLMVKEFELDPFADIWVVIDLDRQVHVGRGPESTEEYAVTVAASLARHFLVQNRSVGLLSQKELLHPDRGSRQLTKVLEWLAVAQGDRWETLGETLTAESLRISRLATVVIVTPSLATDWVVAAHQLTLRGVSVMVALVESATFGSGLSSITTVGSLAAANIPTYLVKRGEPLEGLLTQPSIAAVTAPHARQAVPR
ncbi:MAG: hypothetical protein HW416_364 [Chloroflexi bacterium]|nr:hypothetical protein [Chloroflexota bacterium]